MIDIAYGLLKIVFYLSLLAKGGLGLWITKPAWGQYWRAREYKADQYAARLGQAEELADFLEIHALIHDHPVPFMWLTEHTHPPTELRVDKLRNPNNDGGDEPEPDDGDNGGGGDEPSPERPTRVRSRRERRRRMQTLNLISSRPAERLRAGAARLRTGRRGVTDAPFTPLIDAKAASRLLGVPHTWLLAQARAGQVPHHRLGHYVRFNPDDLKEWLTQTRSMPGGRR